MTEETKKSLLILTKTGGWADDDIDDDVENQETSTKTKAWETIDKPKVVPIGTDFEIPGAKDQEQKSSYRDRQDFGGYKSERGGRFDSRQNKSFRGGSSRGGGFQSRDRNIGSDRFGSGDRRNGDRFGSGDRRDRPQNGFNKKPFDNEGKFGKQQDDRQRKPLNLNPRSSSEVSSSNTFVGDKESPFGNAKPIVVSEVEKTPSSPTPTKKTTSNPFGEATPVAPKSLDVNTDRTESTTTQSKESSPQPKTWRSGKSVDSQKSQQPRDKFEFKKRNIETHDKPKKYQSDSSSFKRNENGNHFKSNRKDSNRYNTSSSNKRKEKKNPENWTEVRPSEGTRRSSNASSNVKATTTVETKIDQNTKNSFALLDDVNE